MRRQAILFSVAGVVGFVVDATVLYIALWMGLGYFAGRVVSFLLAVFATWQVNRRFAFADSRQRSAWREWWHYLAAMSLGGVVNYLAYSAVVVFMPPAGVKPLLAVAAGSAAGMLVNFAGAKFWVFRPR
ncbi:GtrA family protein [Luteibacter aegosomatissinici]|uniref:GtrA family protein n=1 Tax=Luteibacter aegosomatissinici TaxID=2911539 RepID=UPI001FFA097B|nr:GtrA family protein [Luteibacter aegosomatissinici]UPG95340.1 GtrA family protein [Luteibacter aegosomatissinici]